MAAPKARRRMALVRSMGQTIAPPAMPPNRARRALSRASRNFRRFGFIVFCLLVFGCLLLAIGYWPFAFGCWLLALHIVMLNSFQHLSAEKD